MIVGGLDSGVSVTVFGGIVLRSVRFFGAIVFRGVLGCSLLHRGVDCCLVGSVSLSGFGFSRFGVFRLLDRRFRHLFHGRAAFRHRHNIVLGILCRQVDGFHASDFGIDLFGFYRISRFRPCGFGRFAATTPTGAFGLFVLFIVPLAHGFGIGPFFGHKRFAIRHRDLVVIRVNFRKRQEPVPVPAIIHKCRLKRRFDPCYLCEVDVTGKLPSIFGFKVEFLNLVSVDHHNAGLFRVGGVDKHFLSHKSLLHNRNRALPGGLSRLELCLVWAI